jgi:hypothetical protein
MIHASPFNSVNKSIIRNNTLHGNGSGVVLEWGAHDNQIVINTITGNTLNGIQINGALNPNAEGQEPPGTGNVDPFNDIVGNAAGIVSYDDTQTFDATYNWWGNRTGPMDTKGIPDVCGLGYNNPSGLGDVLSQCVDYKPWLNKDLCKNGGWKTPSPPPPHGLFRNQGDCIQFMNTAK